MINKRRTVDLAASAPDANLAQEVAEFFESAYVASTGWTEEQQWKVGSQRDEWIKEDGKWKRERINPNIQRCPFSIRDVEKAMIACPQGKAAGPDLIAAELFHTLEKSHRMGVRIVHPEGGRFEVARVLHWLFEVCWRYGVCPEAWNETRQFPLHKGKGSRGQISNYRPISMTSVIRKAFERTLLPVVMAKVGELDIAQNGFRVGRGMMDQVLNLDMVMQQVK